MALQSKTFTKTGDKSFGLKLVLTENSTSVTANTSSVSYSFYITRGGTGFYASQPFSWNITIGGQSIAISNFKFQISSKDPDEQLIKSGTISVAHNSDGEKTMSFSVSTPDASWISSTYGPKAMSMTGEWALTTIPRASTISATNTNIGSATTIKISRASSSFTHTVTYKFGSLSGTIATKTTSTSISWTVPTTFYVQISKAKYGTATLTCQTYSGSTLLGSDTTTFRATAAESLCKPSVSGTVVSTDALSKTLTGGTSKLIRYISTARATISATAKNSATITSRTVNGQSLTSTKDFAKVETGSFVFSAVDSRGYTSSYTKAAPIVQYIPLTLTPTVTRLTPTGDTVKVSVKGNYWVGNFGAATNALELSYQYQKEGGSWSAETPITGAVISGNTYTASLEVTGIDYQESYVFRFTVKDKAVELTKDTPLSQGVPVFEWGKGDFRFHVPVEVMGTMQSDWCKVDAKGGWSSLSLQKNGVTMSGFTINPDTGNLHILMYYGDSGHAERYVLNAPDKAISEDIVYYLLSTKNVQDYVVATGATKNWRWRKWKSGIAECWQSLWVNTDAFVLENGIYRANVPKSRLTLPFPFTDTPKVLVSVEPNSYEVWLTTYATGGSADNSHTGAYALFRNKAAGADKFVLNYYVQGFYT